MGISTAKNHDSVTPDERLQPHRVNHAAWLGLVAVMAIVVCGLQFLGGGA